MITMSTDDWQAVQRQLSTMQQQIADLTTQLTAAQQRIAELEHTKTPPPAFVKANVPTRPKAVRKQRAPEHNQARQRETPTAMVHHPITQCPGCQGRLSGLHVGRRRQVIEVPPPPPVQVTEHQVQCGWCSYCHRWQEARLDLTGQVVGQGRFGVRLAALITQMRLVLRTPIRLIQSWLQLVHGLTVSLGAISDLLRRVAQQGQPQAAQIHTTIQASAAVNADETTWREQGHQGYIWALATPTGERSFTFRRSRAGAVINGLLGDDFRGVLTTDFYAGYNDTPGGQHQRCWVHLLRDLHALTDLHPSACLERRARGSISARQSGARRSSGGAAGTTLANGTGRPRAAVCGSNGTSLCDVSQTADASSRRTLHFPYRTGRCARQQCGRTRRASLGRRSQDQWGVAVGSRHCHPHDLSLPRPHLAGSGTQPPRRGPTTFCSSFTPTLNSYL